MAKIKGTNKRDVLKGKGLADIIIGLDGNDRLIGGGGDDTLKGGKGNDILDGGAGSDKFIGGAGNDTVTYARSGAAVGVSLDSGLASGGADGDTFKGIENLVGSRFNDFLEGNAGNNLLKGGAGHDTLRGGAGNDILNGGAGNDTLYGGGGADTFIGGAGFDGVYYLTENQRIVIDLEKGKTGGAAKGDTFKGIEAFYGTDFGDVMKGGKGKDFFWGAGGNDVLQGRGGNDVLIAGSGADKISGGKGDDIIFLDGDHDADIIDGGAGNDWVDYHYSADPDGVQVFLSAGIANFGAKGDTFKNVENIAGSAMNDSIGPAKNGWADGRGGNDIVVDAQGTEVLRGGAGDDYLTDNFLAKGEDGLKDIFVLEPDNGLDTIFGFDKGQDLFWLPANMFDKLLFNKKGELADGRVVNSTTPTATAGYAQLLYDTDDKLLWYDADGTGGAAAVLVAKLDGFNQTLSVSDFEVVMNI